MLLQEPFYSFLFNPRDFRFMLDKDTINLSIFVLMEAKKDIVKTPMMQQYFKVKAKYPEAMILFRVGDFYETFSEDAIKASKILGIVLTRRANGSAKYVELAGFPHHSIDVYLPKLVRAGYKVAICDQLEDPKMTKNIVKRGVTELVTPGLAYNEQLLSQKENNFLASLYFEKDQAGIALLDISTGTFKIAQGSLDYIDLLISDFDPKEVLIQKGYEKGFRERFANKLVASSDNAHVVGGMYVSTMDQWAFVYESAYEKLIKQFKINTLKGFGVEKMTLGITAAGAILFYLENTQQAGTDFNPMRGLSHLCSISRLDEGDFVWLDRFTVRNLELIQPLSPDGMSLLHVLDKCSSPMGSRLLRTWISMPSKSLTEIKNRHDVVEEFISIHGNATSEAYATSAIASPLMNAVSEKIGDVGDLERIISRAAAGRISPREVMQLKRGIAQIAPIKKLINQHFEEDKRYDGRQDIALKNLATKLDNCTELETLLNKMMAADPAAQIGKGDVIATGVSEELDEYRKVVRNGKEIIEGIRVREVERTGISSLKISHNNVFGYYLEVRNTFKDKVPTEWIRKQTLVSAERYITEELKVYEEKILTAQTNIYQVEQKLYLDVVLAIQKMIPIIQNNATVLARIDVLLSFAFCAVDYDYHRPVMTDGDDFDIKQGRHPVIERLMPDGQEYVANDLMLDSSTQQIIILTGPNMAGKSALLRQTALISLMAQIGSFVPAAAARLGYVDKIFTRVGASDNISRGESTFMVEMLETSTILHNISHRSLILLDEIGRGTSTYDGMSIAWGIVEFIHEQGFGAKTLFATHYHELNELENIYPRVKNFNIAVKDIDGKIIFLRKLMPGGVAHSFGIHVARLAGMPIAVVHSAEKVLHKLESGDGKTKIAELQSIEKAEKAEEPQQLSFFQLDDPLIEDIRDTLKAADMNQMTPLDAFDLLRSLKRKIGLKK